MLGSHDGSIPIPDQVPEGHREQHSRRDITESKGRTEELMSLLNRERPGYSKGEIEEHLGSSQEAFGCRDCGGTNRHLVSKRLQYTCVACFG